MFLLDTPVIFAISRSPVEGADPRVTAWAGRARREDLFISALALLEIDAHAGGLMRKDKAGAAMVRAWLDGQVEKAFEGRILPVDEKVARRRRDLAYPDARNGLMAATALENGLTLVTREPAAFKAGRVKVFNPWSYDPDAAEVDWRKPQSNPLWLSYLFGRS